MLYQDLNDQTRERVEALRTPLSGVKITSSAMAGL